ncbi:DUF1540 domain-containing protein [Peribacillus asahii]|jgi:hypothetical protein|uniref:Uncharacterized protein n=1 Tax=Peribacillus asahii TaxID=228899 RepID=A0A3T0KU90_9BACI|nr:DUF1540 domain-containing protein [Peribacillus asahii]AZV43843.1 hypothetical protein BAOM_3234 [Peribacillus asahii]USK83578.1 DUF1540 domain-containing protein [Peribacillus asahii]
MAHGVLCEVNSCKNWEQGNKCAADLIYVGNLEKRQTSEIEETGCKTFEPSSS